MRRRINRNAKSNTINGLSEATIKGHLAHLMAALRWAQSMGMLVEIPKVEKPKRAKKSSRTTPMKGRPITGEEFERMLGQGACVVVEQPRGGETINERPELSGRRVARVASWQRLLRGLWSSGLRLDARPCSSIGTGDDKSDGRP